MASAKASAAAGAAPDAPTQRSSPPVAVTWSPKPRFASSPPAGGLNRDEVKRWCDCAKDGNVGAMRAMLAANPSLLHARGTGVGHTALHWACARGEAVAARWLLSEAGADPNAVNSEGATALHAAASNGRMDAVLALANAGRTRRRGIRAGRGRGTRRGRGAPSRWRRFWASGARGFRGAGARVGGSPPAGFPATGRGDGRSTAREAQGRRPGGARRAAAGSPG